MSRIHEAFTSEPWAIMPGELQKIAAILQSRSWGEPRAEEPAFLKRDYQLMAGPDAQKLPGAFRGYSVGGVAVLPVVGPIFPRANMMTEMSGATSISILQNDYRVALQNSEIGAILLAMDSPGGQVSGINAFADQVAAGAKKKQTICHIQGTGASAAYWIASACNEIMVERTAIVGSIGVVAAMPKQVAPDSNGDIWIDIVSSNAPNKRPDPQSEDGLTEIRATLDAIEKQFIADVARGRNVSADQVRAEFGQGGVKVGSAAVAAGMADKMQSYDATLNAAMKQVANAKRMQALKG